MVSSKSVLCCVYTCLVVIAPGITDAQSRPDRIVLCDHVIPSNMDLTFSGGYELTVDGAGRVQSVQPFQSLPNNAALMACLQTWELPLTNDTIRVWIQGSYVHPWKRLLLFNNSRLPLRIIRLEESAVAAEAPADNEPKVSGMKDEFVLCEELYSGRLSPTPDSVGRSYALDIGAAGQVMSVDPGSDARTRLPALERCLMQWRFSVPNVRVHVAMNVSLSDQAWRIDVNTPGQPPHVMVIRRPPRD